MNCQEVIEYMQRQLDLDLTEVEESLLEEHLASCASCRTAMSRLQRLTSELTNLPKVHPPVSLVDAIMPQLVEIDQASQRGYALSEESNDIQAARERKQARDKSRLPIKLLGGVVAASLLLGVVIVNLNQDKTQQMASDSGNSADMNFTLASSQAAGEAEREDLEIQSKMLDKASSFDDVGIQEFVPDQATSNHSGFQVMEEHSRPAPLPEAPAESQAGAVQERAVADQKEDTVSSEVPSFDVGMVELVDQYGVSSGYQSPDGTYSAYIENGLVVILDTNNEKIYTSQSFADAEIYELNWQDDNRITFKIRAGNSEDAYFIDVAERTEGSF